MGIQGLAMTFLYIFGRLRQFLGKKNFRASFGRLGGLAGPNAGRGLACAGQRIWAMLFLVLFVARQKERR